MVAMRKTRNESKSHHKPTVPRVQPLLKCPFVHGWTTRQRHLTERCLQLDGSQHDRITQLVIHQQQPESQQLLPVAARASTERRGLASHSCEAGLSQGHPHIAGYHTATCQQLSTPQRHSTPLNPPSTGWVHT
jgi:hypothetical protein